VYYHSSSGLTPGAIVGIAVGVTVACCCFVCLFVFYHRRGDKKSDEAVAIPKPSASVSSGSPPSEPSGYDTFELASVNKGPVISQTFEPLPSPLPNRSISGTFPSINDGTSNINLTSERFCVIYLPDDTNASTEAQPQFDRHGTPITKSDVVFVH